MTATATYDLKSRIERFVSGVPAGEERAAREAIDALREALATGTVRAAERADDGQWHANSWVKAGILLGFRLGAVVPVAEGGTLRLLRQGHLAAAAAPDH